MTRKQAAAKTLIAYGVALSGALLTAAAQEPAGGNAVKPPSVRATCPNYVEALSASVYPRDAIVRRIDTGEAIVDFVVDHGRAEQIRVVSASDPVFGETAAAAVARLECEPVEQPVHFRVPFKFQRSR